MRFLRWLVLSLLVSPALAQIPAPQINLTGSIGCQGFPCVNNGTLVLSSDSDHTLTAQETSAFYMRVTSSVSLTATRNLIAPAGRFPFTIENSTTGAQSIEIIGTSGTGVTIPNGQTISVWNDGTNFVQVGASGGGGGCAEGTCVQNNPVGTQTVTQPAGTTLQANNFQNAFYAAMFGSGSNGIETVYNNASYCIPQGNGISDGCTIDVSPLYANADAPQGWKWQGNYYGGSVNGLLAPSGTAAYDYRNGTMGLYYRDPANPTGGQSGLSSRTDITQNLGTRTYTAGGSYDPTGLSIETNQYAGGWDFLYYLYMPQYVEQNYEFGLNNVMENWSDGISFAQQNILRCHGLGDCLENYVQVTADGGVAAANSEGTEIGDYLAQEDPVDFYGYINSVTSTTINVGCNQGCGTEGQDRIFLDYTSAAAINGTVATGYVNPQTTGVASNSAIMPPQILDTTQSFPVSTMFQLCNPGANNGAGGAAGCTAGSQPIGVIPPTPLSISITAGSVASNVGSFTGTNALVAGQSVILYGFSGNGTPLNNLPATVLSGGLSTSAFQVSVTAPDIASTGAGESTESSTGFSPPPSITLNVVAPYTGTGGNTNGTPAGFCTSSTLQSTSSGSSCYLPSSGYLYLTDGIEYESDAYTYNSGTQQVTITGMVFPHLNGVVGSYGGVAGWALQDNANLVNGSSGLGVVGTIAPTYAIAGAVSATDVYYISQRTNEQYGLPPMGISNPSNGNQGYGRQLYFSVNMSGFSISGGTVTFNMSTPPQVSGDLHMYNGLTAAIVVSSNTTYSCAACVITWVGNNTFKYTPSAPSGTVPTTGSITYNNAGYTLFPAARVKSVFDTATNKVDGVMTIYPITVANDPIAATDYGREAHYQQVQISGQHVAIHQFQPNQYTGTEGQEVNYAGYIIRDGFRVGNQNPSSLYLGRGGNWSLPQGSGYVLAGDWVTSFQVGTAPDQNLIQVSSGKSGFGVSSPYSNFNVFAGPTLASQNPQPGTNAMDCMNYDPNANVATRSAGTDSGTFWFENCFPIATVEGSGQQSFTHVRSGYFNADQGVTAKNVNAKNIFTSQSTGITVYANPITSGATVTNYWVVGHAAGGGTTTAIAAVLTGASTPNNQICMPYQGQYSSYDIYRGSTSNLIATGVVVNGLSVVPIQPANYACFDDNNTTPTTSPAPTVNNTGGVIAAGPVVGNGFQDTAVTVAGCGQLDSSGNLSSTGTACGSGGGGVSGGVTGYFSLFGGATSITGPAHMDDGVTTTSTITSTEVIAAPGVQTTGTTPYIETGLSTNTDLAGQLTLVGGTNTYTFANTYATAPICVATDTTAANAVQVTTSTTVLTVTGTSTDVINYICVGRT